MTPMTPRRFVLESPDRFVADAIGRPGRRTFYLQVRQGRATVSVALEKFQLQILAERLALLLDEVERRGLDRSGEGEAGGLAARTSATLDTEPLEQPVVPLFRAGAMVLAWHVDEQRITLETRSEADPEADAGADTGDDEPPAEHTGDLVRVTLTAAMARDFVRRAVRVVSSGRPPCPVCGQPLDSDGHICPRKGAYLN